MNLLQLPKTLKHRKAKPFFAPKIIAISALSFFSGHAFAQTGFDFGLKGIVQASSLINGPDYAAGNELNFKNRAAFGGGVGAGYSFNKHIGAEIDILYSPEGTQYTGDETLIPAVDKGAFGNELKRVAQLNNIPFSGNYTASTYLNYIKIPILFRYNTNNTKTVFFSLFLGPQFDILSSATMKINGQTVNTVGTNLKASDVYNKSGFDGVLGLGLGINLSKNFVLTGHLRFDYGFGDAENKSATDAGSPFYSSKRGTTNNATGGGLISLNYKLVKKEKEKEVKKKVSDEDNDGDNDENMESKSKPKAKTTTTPPPPAPSTDTPK